MCTHTLNFEQTYENYQSFVSEKILFFEVKFSMYLNRSVFVMLHVLVVYCNDSMMKKRTIQGLNTS